MKKLFSSIIVIAAILFFLFRLNSAVLAQTDNTVETPYNYYRELLKGYGLQPKEDKTITNDNDLPFEYETPYGRITITDEYDNYKLSGEVEKLGFNDVYGYPASIVNTYDGQRRNIIIREDLLYTPDYRKKLEQYLRSLVLAQSDTHTDLNKVSPDKNLSLIDKRVLEMGQYVISILLFAIFLYSIDRFLRAQKPTGLNKKTFEKIMGNYSQDIFLVKKILTLIVIFGSYVFLAGLFIVIVRHSGYITIGTLSNYLRTVSSGSYWMNVIDSRSIITILWLLFFIGYLFALAILSGVYIVKFFVNQFQTLRKVNWIIDSKYYIIAIMTAMFAISFGVYKISATIQLLLLVVIVLLGLHTAKAPKIPHKNKYIYLLGTAFVTVLSIYITIFYQPEQPQNIQALFPKDNTVVTLPYVRQLETENTLIDSKLKSVPTFDIGVDNYLLFHPNFNTILHHKNWESYSREQNNYIIPSRDIKKDMTKLIKTPELYSDITSDKNTNVFLAIRTDSQNNFDTTKAPYITVNIACEASHKSVTLRNNLVREVRGSIKYDNDDFLFFPGCVEGTFSSYVLPIDDLSSADKYIVHIDDTMLLAASTIISPNTNDSEVTFTPLTDIFNSYGHIIVNDIRNETLNVYSIEDIVESLTFENLSDTDDNDKTYAQIEDNINHLLKKKYIGNKILLWSSKPFATIKNDLKE